MRPLGPILLVVGSLWSIPPYAQEGGSLRAKADSAACGLLLGPSEGFSVDWLRERVDPIQRERQALRRLMEERARRSVVEVPEARRDLREETGLWRFRIGNTTQGNWSPFPDRALDARIIRFPLPRDMQADKRPEQQKTLEGMRKGK